MIEWSFSTVCVSSGVSGGETGEMTVVAAGDSSVSWSWWGEDAEVVV